MLKQRRLAARWKLLVIPIVVVAAVGVGLAIALPASMASTHRRAAPVPAQSDRARDRPLGTATHATADPGPGRRAASHRAASRTGCAVRYAPVNWPGAFLAEVTISNRGKTSIHGWKLTFRFPGDEAISSAWNATFTQNGADVSARNLSFDATIRQGASQSLGFLGSFSVNGTVCR